MAAPITTETLPPAPGGMVTAVSAAELDDTQAEYIQDALLDFPGIQRRRGPVRRVSWPAGIPERASGLLMTLDPSGKDRYAVLNGSAVTGTFSAYSADRAVRADITWPHTLPTLPDTVGFHFRVVDSKSALGGGTWVGVSSAYDSAAPNQGIALWKGAAKANYTTGTLTVGRGSAAVTGSGTSWSTNVEPGMFLFANVDAPESYSMTLVGVVKTVNSNTSITLDVVSPYNITGKAYTLQTLRGFAPQVSKGRITCDTASTTVTGGNTKFVSQGITNSGTWNLYRSSDFAWIGKVSSVVSETSITLAANAAISVADAAYVAIRADSDWGIETPSNVNKIGFLNAVYAGRQFWANNGAQLEKTYRLWYSDPDYPDAVDMSADGDWITINSTGSIQEGIRAIQPAYNALVINKETETFALYGSSPSTFSVKKLEDDGCLSGMSVQSYAGGVIWAGRHGIHFYDGIETTNLTEPILGDVWKNSVVSIDSSRYRMWSMMVRQHYMLFIEKLAPTISVVKGNTSETPTSWVVSINMVTRALSLFTNVAIRGAVQLPGTATETVWYLVNDGTKGNVCSADALFDETGLDDFIADGGYFQETLLDLPKGYWTFTNASPLTDWSGNLNTLTAIGAPTNVAGLLTDSSDTARAFSGSGQAYTAADSASLDLGDVFTLEVWIKPDVVSGSQVLFSKGTGAYMLKLNGTAVELHKEGTGLIVASTGVTLAVGQTYHIVATKESSNETKLYVNGVDVTGTVTDRTCVDTSTALNIGRLSDATTYFDGVIDEPAVYNRILTPEEVLRHYRFGVDQAITPDYYFVSKKFNAGDALRLKRFVWLLLHYLVHGDSLKVDVVLGLNDVGKTLAKELPSTTYTWDSLKVAFSTWDGVKAQFATWSALMGSVFRPKRLRFMKKSQHFQFRVYQKSANVTQLTIGPFQLGYKYMRPGRT